MKNLEIKNLQSNFNQAEDALTIPVESMHDYKCGSATQSGRSMIEMLGVLAIIGVLSVGGIEGYSKAMMKYRINKTIEQITLIAGNVRTFFAPQRSYKGLNICRANNDACKLIKKAKLVPDEMWDDTDKQFYSVFGNIVDLYTAHKSTDTDTQAFIIEYQGIPPEICIELATQDWAYLGKSVINISSSYGCGSPSCGGSSTNKYFVPPANIEDIVDVCYAKSNYGASISFYIDVDVFSSYWQNKINPTS